MTIREIAQLAGVSKSTVSLVIRDSPSIPASTKAKVREIMESMHYTPDARARNLAEGRSYTVGMVIEVGREDLFFNPYFYAMVSGAEMELCRDNLDLVISNASSRTRPDFFIEHFVAAGRVDGLIVPDTLLSEAALASLEERAFPFVVIGESGDGKVPCVDADNFRSGEIAARHLLEVGYERVAYIGGRDDGLTVDRIAGARAALPSLLVFLSGEGRGGAEGGRALADAALSSAPRPEALICADNYIAAGALEAARRRGLSLPRDLGLVSFDDYPLAPYLFPSLTAVRLDLVEIGRRAAAILLRRIRGEPVSGGRERIEPSLVVRDSTRRGPKAGS
jgi:Transcriptional regulators